MSATAHSFADCVVHEDARELWVGGRAVDIQRLQFDLLLYFLHHPQRAIGKDELLTEVWRTVNVSESVLARAVMKLRRAIGDDGDTSGIIRTVHRVGYHFTATVKTSALQRDELHHAVHGVVPVAPTPTANRPRLDLAFLRLDNRTGHDTLEWTCLGLPALLAHMCEQRGLRIAAAKDVAALETEGQSQAVRTHLVCDALDLPRVASMVLTMPGDLQLEVSLRGPQVAACDRVFVERDVANLATQVAQWLAAQASAQGSAEPPLPASVLELFARAESELEQARFRNASHLLLECAEHVPDSLRIRLSLARARQELGQMDLAAIDGEWVRAGAELAGLAEVQIKSCLLLTNVYLMQGRLDESSDAVQQARRLCSVLDDRDLDAVVAQSEAQLAMKQGRLDLATQRLEYALARLSGGRNARAQIAVRTALTVVLIKRQLLTRASMVLDRAKQQLQLAPSVLLGANVAFQSATVAYMRRQYGNAAQQFDQARLMFEAADRRLRAWRATNMRLYARADGGALSEVRDECLHYLALNERPGSDARWRPQSQGPYVQVFLRELLIDVEWRMGDKSALDRYLALVAEMAAMPYCADILPERRCLVTSWLARERRLKEAQALCSQIDPVATPFDRGVADASILVAQGQPAAAMQVLDRLMRQADLSSTMGSALAINACWLKLELGDNEGVDSLIAHIDDFCEDYAPAAVVRARFMMQSGQHQEAQAELQRVLLHWPESPQPIVHELLGGDQTLAAQQRRLCLLTYDLGP